MANRAQELAKLPVFHPDITYSDESPASRLKAELYVRDYGAVGDAQLRTVADWVNPGLPTRIKYADLAALRVDYPHVTSVDDSMDWAAIQKAISTGKNIGFHDGRYRIGSNQLVSTVVGQCFFGLTSSIGANLGDPASKGAIIMWTPPAGATSQAAWEARNSHQRFVGLKFWGDTLSVDNVGLRGKKSSNTDDMDLAVLDCEFYMCFRPIEAFGRGLFVDRCTFSQIKGGSAVVSDWQETGAVGSEGQTDDRYKGRALRVTRNRLHGTGTLLTIRNYVARGAAVSLNHMDLGNRLMLVECGWGVGGVLHADLTGNIADASGLSVIQFNPGTICDGLNISGGALGGVTAGTVDGADKRPFAIIAFNGCSKIDGVSITGVDLHDTDALVLQFANDSNKDAIVPRNISIVGCMIRGIGQSGANRAIINSVYDIENLNFDPGTISDLGPSIVALIRTEGRTITNITARHGLADPAIPLIANTTMAGRVSVHHVEGAFGTKADGSVRFGNLGGYSGSLPVEYNRENSNFGVGARYRNALGDFGWYGTPSGSGAGTFGPDADILVDLASSAYRLRRSYVATRYYTGAVWDGAGTGSPEGSKVGAIGSTWRRTDAAIGPKLFVKRSGAGTLGWKGVVLEKGGPLDRFNIPQRNWLTSNNWISSTSAADNSWYSVCWSPRLGLFVAVATTGTGNRVMTSQNGEVWTLRTSAADNSWRSVCWSPELELFVAVANSGTGNRVMTSKNGEDWTLRTSAADNSWRSVCWSPELRLFVAVSSSGTTDSVMTSPDGEVWTLRTIGTANAWTSVCWSPELELFVAVGNNGAGYRVMTSQNGEVWTQRASAADNSWESVCWSAELSLFVAVASTGIGNRVMTSKTGEVWTQRASAADNSWASVRWSGELGLFVAVGNSGTGNRVMTSPDGEVWTLRTSAADNSWVGLCWSPELGLFCGVGITGTGNRVMTSKSAYSLSYR